MKVAIPEWRGRVSPVFDVARTLLLVEVKDGGERDRRELHVTAKEPKARADFVGGLGADVVICGAISWRLEMALSAAGVRVISQTCGDVEQVLSAFIAGRLDGEAFLMPGCSRRRHGFLVRGRGGRRWHGRGWV